MPSKGQTHISLTPTEASIYANEIKAGNYIDVFLNEARRYLDRDDGRQRDLNKAYEFFKAAAELGSEAAWYYLALFHRAGVGKLPDENEFFSCLERARQLEQTRLRSKRDSHPSQVSGPLHNALGVAYMEGAGCPRNLRRASRFFKTAVLANDGQALNNLSLSVLEAVEEVRDKVQVLIDVLETVRDVTPAVHRAATFADDEWSQSDDFTTISERHGEFDCNNVSPSAGMPANAIEQLSKVHILCNSLGEAAVRSMRSRAEFGDYLRGMYNVAVASERGLAGAISSEDVMKTYRVVARSPGYGPAQVALAKYIFWAMMKKSDTLSEEDLTSMHCDGFRYLHRAAEANHPEAQAIYAAIYREGAFNVDPSPAEAETCFRLAVENGWRGDGTETVQSLIAAPSDYERFMQELVPENRQIVSRRATYRRRANTPHSQASTTSTRPAQSTALLSRTSAGVGAQRAATLHHYHHPSTKGRHSRAGSDLRLLAVLREETQVNPIDDQTEAHRGNPSSVRKLSSSEIPSLLALAEPTSGASASAKHGSGQSAGRRNDIVPGGQSSVQVLLDEAWVRAPLTGASTTASSLTEAHGNAKLPPRDSSSAPQHAIPSGMLGGAPTSTKAHIARTTASSIATRPCSDFDLATDTPPTKSLAEMASVRLPSCDLRPSISPGPPKSAEQSAGVGGDEGGGGGGGGAYRFSRRSRHNALSQSVTPPTSSEQTLLAIHDSSMPGRAVAATSAQVKGEPSLPMEKADEFASTKVAVSRFHSLFPTPPETNQTSSGGSASRSYHATWEDEAFEDGSDKSRSDSLPGTVTDDNGGDLGAHQERIVPCRQRGVLRLSNLKSFIAFGPKPTCAAWMRRLEAFTLHETALHLLLTQAPFSTVIDLLTRSYCLHPLVPRREPPTLSTRLTSTLQKLLEASVDDLNTLQPVVVFLYRFLLYNRGIWASGAALVGGVPSSAGTANFRRFSDAAPTSPTLPPLVSRCLETLNRFIDSLELSEKSTTTTTTMVPPSLSSEDSHVQSTSSCALWNLYLLRAMLKSRVLRYLDAADLNKAIDGCPPDRTYEVYYTYLTLMRECIGPDTVSPNGTPGLTIASNSSRDSRTIDTYLCLLGKYLDSAPPEDMARFSHFSGFFTSLEPSRADLQSVTSLIERWAAKAGEVDYSAQFQSPWQLEAKNHHSEKYGGDASKDYDGRGAAAILVSSNRHV